MTKRPTDGVKPGRLRRPKKKWRTKRRRPERPSGSRGEGRVLPEPGVTGNSSLDLSRAPELPSATPIPLSRKRFEVSDH